jgi:hypothetical protein
MSCFVGFGHHTVCRPYLLWYKSRPTLSQNIKHCSMVICHHYQININIVQNIIEQIGLVLRRSSSSSVLFLSVN